MNDNTIEQLLRKAPRLQTPERLREDLERGIELPRTRVEELNPPLQVSWTRRWLPALSFSAWFLVCTVVFAFQAFQIAKLREENRSRLLAQADAAEMLRQAEAAQAGTIAELDQLRRDLADVERLRTERDQLQSEAAELTTLRAQNQLLRDELKAQGKLPPKPEEDFFVVMAERAARTRCISNLKQVCMAALIWASDHGQRLPTDYESMATELNGDKITFCPRDGVTRYQILSPGTDRTRPDIVYVRCGLHEIVGMVDGSVQQLPNPRQLVQRDGKWVLVRNAFE